MAAACAALWAPLAQSAPASSGGSQPKAIEGAAVEVGRNVSLWSDTLGEARPLQIYVPPSHDKRHAPCIVVYVLDGGGNYLHTVAALQFLADAGRIPDAIVVAIPNVDRGRDLTPNVPGCGDDCGHGDRFLTFLTKELIPWVDSHYHTAPFRVLTGHSRGGLYALNTLLNEPEAFNAYIAMSPALWWNGEIVLKGAEEKLKRLPPRRFLYMTDGDESEDLTKVVAKAVALLERAAPPNLDWKYQHLPNEEHMTTRHRSIYNGMESVFSGMQPPREVIRDQGIAGIEAHYAKLPARYGFDIPLPLGMADWCGYYLLQQKKPAMAVEVFQRNVEHYPTEPQAYSSLASALQAAGRQKEALEAATQAYRLSAPW